MKSNEERILEGATGLFIQHGFAKVTMGDIANAAGMSRPTLYQAYANKEEVFLGLYRQFCGQFYHEIEQIMDTGLTPELTLKKIFTVWTIEPYKMVQKSPYADELLSCSFDFAKKEKEKAYIQLEKYVARVLEHAKTTTEMTAQEISHLICSTMRGLKTAVHSAKDLEKLIDQFLMLVFA